METKIEKLSELNQSDDVKNRLREIMTLANRMCLNKEQQLEFTKFLIEKYLTSDHDENMLMTLTMPTTKPPLRYLS